MTEPLRILSIGAHPADIFDQCGGTMAHHTARGDWVGCVVLTHGARVHDKVISDSMHGRETIPEASVLEEMIEERSDVKAQEVRRACGLLGVEDLYFFGADDAILLVTEEMVRRLARLLRELRPNVILTHYPKEGDGVAQPHAITGTDRHARHPFRSLGRPGGPESADQGGPGLLLRDRRRRRSQRRLVRAGRGLQRRADRDHRRGG